LTPDTVIDHLISQDVLPGGKAKRLQLVAGTWRETRL
jgi:hypothetical protein